MIRGQAENLAHAVPQQGKAKLTAKIGCTNSEFVVHIQNHDERSSQTIKDEGEWLAHDWNKLNRRRKPRPKDEDDFIISARQHLTTPAQRAAQNNESEAPA